MDDEGLDLAAALRPVAVALGDGWSVGDTSYARTTLVGPDGLGLHVRTEGWRAAARGRWYITGSFDGLHEHVSRGGRAEISVSGARPPEHIARDLQRRLIPGYRDALAEARRRKAASDAEEADRDALAEAITTALGPPAENSGTGTHRHRDHAHVRLGRYGDPVDATFEVPAGNYAVTVAVRVAKDRAVRLAEAIGGL